MCGLMCDDEDTGDDGRDRCTRREDCACALAVAAPCELLLGASDQIWADLYSVCASRDRDLKVPFEFRHQTLRVGAEQRRHRAGSPLPD